MTARASYPRPMGVLPPIEPRLQRILEENAERERQIVSDALGAGALVGLVTTEDSAAVAKVVDMITDDPARFAVRFLGLERCVQQLAERVSGLAAREAV